MTAELLASTATRRKAVLDTCAVFQGAIWHQQFKEPVTDWLGADGVAVLPGRVIAEIAHVAAKKQVGDDKPAIKEAVQRRAALALRHPQRFLGLAGVRRAVLTRADVARLCRDNADPELVRREWRRNSGTKQFGWVSVPGDADFEIAHTVRVLTGAQHDAALVTRDGDLTEASARLGVTLFGQEVVVASSAGAHEGTGAALPAPGSAPLRLLGPEAAQDLLSGRRPVLGNPGDTAVVLSSTLVLAAQRAASSAAGRLDEQPDGVTAVQQRLDELLNSGRVEGGSVRVHVWATPWPVYRLLAERVVDARFARKDEGSAWDMHTLLVLCAAEVLGEEQHEVHLLESTAGGTARLTAGARGWRTVGGLLALAGAGEYRRRQRVLAEVALPKAGGEVDMRALLRRFGQH